MPISREPYPHSERSPPPRTPAEVVHEVPRSHPPGPEIGGRRVRHDDLNRAEAPAVFGADSPSDPTCVPKTASIAGDLPASGL